MYVLTFQKTEPRERAAVPDFKACHHVDTTLTFASKVHHWMQQLDANDWIDQHDISSFNHSLNEAFSHTSSETNDRLLQKDHRVPRYPLLNGSGLLQNKCHEH